MTSDSNEVNKNSSKKKSSAEHDSNNEKDASVSMAGGGATSRDYDDDKVLVDGGMGASRRGSAGGGAGGADGGKTPTLTSRARRRREEAVRRLVADVHSKLDPKFLGDTSTKTHPEAHEWLVASTVATALEKGLDRDLQSDLVQEQKDNANRIGQICHDHSEVFLASVAKVAALGNPSAELAKGLESAQEELQENTVKKMQQAAILWEEARSAHTKAKALYIMVHACQRVAQYLERARKQASLGRPQAALDAVDQARQALTAPMATLFYGSNIDHNVLFNDGPSTKTSVGGATASSTAVGVKASETAKKLARLEETPFGRRATLMLPKIENEVLISARRGLNRWFLSLRSGEGATIGRAVLRRCANSIAKGPGQLGLGGHVPPSYLWRSKTADNLIARVNQSGKVARAVRSGYWFQRDAKQEAARLETTTTPGMDRRAEAFAAAFGWYRCWYATDTLLVDPSEFVMDDNSRKPGGDGLSGSRHGMGGSRHGRGANDGGIEGSGGRSLGFTRGGGRSLGFQASAASRSLAMREGVTKNSDTGRPKWSQLLTPEILFENAASRKEDDAKFLGLPESVHPVRRAELAFTLLGKSEEFVQFYEQNRFGDIKITTGANSSQKETAIAEDGKDKEKRSCLSSLTGDDVSVGTTRIFFAQRLLNLCASVVGFCAVEAALELGAFYDDDDDDIIHDRLVGGGGVNGGGDVGTGAGASGEDNNNLNTNSNPTGTGSGSNNTKKSGMQYIGRFRESSERYERALVAELGTLLRQRAIGANLAELSRASCLMASFRSALKIVHPSSSTRRSDKELLAMDVDILMIAVKVAQDEQLKATAAIVADDKKQPMPVMPIHQFTGNNNNNVDNSRNNIPEPEDVGVPFGLSKMKLVLPEGDAATLGNSSGGSGGRFSGFNSRVDEYYTFSHSVPDVLRSIHARAIAVAYFALSQEELGQTFPQDKHKKGSASAGYVLDCVEECINVAAVGMTDSAQVSDEGSVEKAVQCMANVLALQNTLPRLFGTLMRGMCHVGLIRSDEVDETFEYSEKTLKNADKKCDSQVGSMYSLVYEICKNKIDSHLNYALDNFPWVAKVQRDTPNAYCEGVIGYLRMVFSALGPMDEGSRAGLHFSCMSHVSERLVRLLTDPISGHPANDESKHGGNNSYHLQPISRIDAFGIKNLSLDVEEFMKFSDSTKIPQLRQCFNELQCITDAMLDKNLPILLQPQHASQRQDRYQFLSMNKLANVLEKYQGTGFGDKLSGRSGPGTVDFLFIEKKEVNHLLKLVKSQMNN